MNELFGIIKSEYGFEDYFVALNLSYKKVCKAFIKLNSENEIPDVSFKIVKW